jgi:hypothetical protein
MSQANTLKLDSEDVETEEWMSGKAVWTALMTAALCTVCLTILSRESWHTRGTLGTLGALETLGPLVTHTRSTCVQHNRR